MDYPDRERFDAIWLRVSDEALLEEAQTILLRSGALSYGFYQIQEYYDQARLALEDLSLADDPSSAGCSLNCAIPWNSCWLWRRIEGQGQSSEKIRVISARTLAGSFILSRASSRSRGMV